MIDSFITSFRLKNAYRVNSIIYSLKQLPLIGKILPVELYQDTGVKIFGNIISILIELGSIFVNKSLYIVLMIYAMGSLFKTNDADTFLHIFTFLSVAGALINTYMFNPTKDKYYAMILMKMDARKYTLCNYYYQLLKIIIGFMPFTIIFGLMSDVPFLVCLILPLLTVMLKMIVSNCFLIRFLSKKKVTSENLPDKVLWSLVIGLLLITYGLPYFGITITIKIFLVIFIIILLLGVYSFIRINDFPYYRQMYKQLLTKSNVYFVQEQTSAMAVKESVAKQIKYDDSFKSNKEGYAYFHDLFVKRHRKILTDAVMKQMFVAIVILVVVIAILIIYDSAGKGLNNILLTCLPYFVFIMYMLNRGTTYTQAMFMNCDHSMLSFRIFRTPRVILGLFKERLKTLISLNLRPAMIIAIGLPLILWFSGGTDNILNYAVLFFSIIAMSIFFSVHYLVMYYLLQPYNINVELKSSTYKVVQSVTYLVCYFMINLQLPTLVFGGVVIIFSVLYSIISLYIAYRYAHKTFKLRV